ncbi:MAG TPA: hypothetical protein VIK55_19460 [Paludibacter sp.]
MKNIYYNQIEDAVKEKCWKLSSYILAEYDFKNLEHPWNEPWCLFGNTFKDMFENTFIKELIEVAAIMRSLQDIHPVDKSEVESAASYSNTVGILTILDNIKIQLLNATLRAK